MTQRAQLVRPFLRHATFQFISRDVRSGDKKKKKRQMKTTWAELQHQLSGSTVQTDLNGETVTYIYRQANRLEQHSSRGTCPVAVSTMSSIKKQGRMAGGEEKGECCTARFLLPLIRSWQSEGCSWFVWDRGAPAVTVSWSCTLLSLSPSVFPLHLFEFKISFRINF